MQEEEKDKNNSEQVKELPDVQQEEEEILAPVLKACVLHVSGLEFSLPVEFLVEIVEIEEVYTLPLVPEYIRGLVHYRGRALPLVDLGVIHNRPPRTNLKGAFGVVTEYAGELLVFLSDTLPALSEEFAGETIEISEFFDTYRIR